MELITNTKCDVRAFVTLNPDGSLAVKVTAHADYATGMSTSAEITEADLPAEPLAAIKSQLEALVQGQTPKLSVLVQHAIHESRRVGRAARELDASFTPIPAVAAPAAAQTEGTNA